MPQASRQPALRPTVARLALLCAMLLACMMAAAQQTSPPVPVAPHARLMAARTILVEHAGGRIPNDVIGDAFQGWGHYRIVFDRAEADLIASINAPVADTGVSVSGRADERGGSSTSSRNLSSAAVTQIRLTILDAHDRAVLWTGTEQPKGSIKGKQREDNEVDASLKLFRRFRMLIEPAD